MAYDPALVSALEPDQLVAATTRPLPRRKLTRESSPCWSRCASLS